MNDSITRENLTWRGDRAKPRREVERTAAVPAFGQWHRLAGVEPDADAERKRRSAICQLAATALDLDRRADSLTGGGENDERLVSAQLDQVAVVVSDDPADDVSERGGERGGGLVAVLLREARVPPDVGDQECADDRSGTGSGLLVNPLVAAVDVSV